MSPPSCSCTLSTADNGQSRAVALFVHGTRVYEVETDMLPGVQLLAQSDEKSQAERLTWLEGRAAPGSKVAASPALQAQLKLQDEAAVALRANG